METTINDSGGSRGHGGNEIYSSRSPAASSTSQVKDIYNTDGKLGSVNGGIYGKTPNHPSTHRQVVEIPFLIHRDRPPKWISGINRSTTCRDILLSLVRAAHSSSKANPESQTLLYTETDVFLGKLVLVEEWKGVVKPLSPNSRILKIWNAWGEERSHVNFIVKRASTTSNRNSGENSTTSDALIHKTLVSRNSSISRRQDVIPNISSSGTARTRRKVRRRNSTSSVGSRQSIDEMHPKALNDLDQRCKRTDSRSFGPQHSNLVNNTINNSENSTHYCENKEGNNNDHSYNNHRSKTSVDDEFDQHIEEMLRVIVAQGRKIHDQLQRLEDKKSSSKSPSRVKVQAEIHTPLSSSHKESDSATSSNYDSTSTSTSTNPPKRVERSTKSSRNGTLRKFQQADFVRHPNSSNLPISGLPSTMEGMISKRTSSLGTRSKSYDNYETIFPLTQPLLNQNVEGNLSVDQLPRGTAFTSDNSPKLGDYTVKSSSSSAINNGTLPVTSKLQKTASTSATSVNGKLTASSSQSSIYQASASLSNGATSMDTTPDRHKNISMKQTNNSDFQIVDITNVPNMQKGNDGISCSDNIHNISFSSSSASEAAGGNVPLCVRSSVGSEKLNQSFDLMNLSVVANSSPAIGSTLPSHAKQSQCSLGETEGSPSNRMGVKHDNEAEIRLQRDKLILKTIHSELTKLVQMNDRLTFAEDSVDRLKIAIRQVQDQKEYQADPSEHESILNDASNLSMTDKEAQEHIARAKEELERLKVANDDASKVIEMNRGNIEDIDKKVKEGKATLKHLEYDVNVIEKESRKLNKELEKVMNLDVGGNGVNSIDSSESNIQSEISAVDTTLASESLDISVCNEDVTIMSRINGSVDNSNPEDSVDSSTMFPELLQLDCSAKNELKNQASPSTSKIDNSNQSLREKRESLGPLLPIATDISALPRVTCFEDMRMAINGSPAGSGASSSGNSSDKSVRFSDTEIIHPHHEYTTSSTSLTPDLPDLPDEPASRGSYTNAIKNGCTSSIMSLLAKSAANNSSMNKPILKSQKGSEGKAVNGAGANVDVDTDNSDTGLSSLHSSSDEATFDAGTLV